MLRILPTCRPIACSTCGFSGSDDRSSCIGQEEYSHRCGWRDCAGRTDAAHPFGCRDYCGREACPPRIGSEAGWLLREEILSGATLDIHAADQVLIYLALAGSSSRFLARNRSSHVTTTIWLLEQFLPVRFSVSPAGHLVRIEAQRI